jgi:Cytochrome C oxidase, cbb3-type, subunit III
MGSAWHEVSALGRPATRWGSLLAMLLVAACGGDRDAARAGDEGNVATVDTATTSRAVPTADTAAAPGITDTAASGGDTAAAKQPSATAKRPKPAPKPVAPKPAPSTQAPDTSAGTQTPTQPQQAARDTSQGTPQTAEAPLRDAYHQAPRDTVDQATYDGWKQYNLNCARCHGEDVLGTTIAPHLIVSMKPDGPINTQELFVQTVCAGRPAKGMPSWCALGMDPAKINQIYSYVKGRSEGKIAPGRPAVRQGG